MCSSISLIRTTFNELTLKHFLFLILHTVRRIPWDVYPESIALWRAIHHNGTSNLINKRVWRLKCRYDWFCCAAPHAHLPSLLSTLWCAQGSSVRWRLRKVSHFRVKYPAGVCQHEHCRPCSGYKLSSFISFAFHTDTCQVVWIALIGGQHGSWAATRETPLWVSLFNKVIDCKEDWERIFVTFPVWLEIIP